MNGKSEHIDSTPRQHDVVDLHKRLEELTPAKRELLKKWISSRNDTPLPKLGPRPDNASPLKHKVNFVFDRRYFEKVYWMSATNTLGTVW